MRMIEVNFGPEYFQGNANVRELVLDILTPWTFADACCVDAYAGEGRLYFRCPNAKAGVFMRLDGLNEPSQLEWLRQNLIDTLS